MAVDSEGHQAEEDRHSDQRSSSRCREELPVLDLTVPEDREHEDQQRHHHAPHVERHLNLVCGMASHPPPLVYMLRNMAVEHTVVGQVERGQGPSIVLQELALIDQPHLLLLTRKVRPETDKRHSDQHRSPARNQRELS